MAYKRYVTYFSVAIPPFKEKKLGAGTTTIRFVITGSICSKKNNTQAVVRRKEARAYITSKAKENGGIITPKDAQIAIGMTNAKIMPNLAYNAWVEEQRPIIEKQREFWMNRLQKKGLFFPLKKASMSIRFYFANDYFIDSISKQESVQDLLTDLKIIQDDNYKVLNPIYTASAQYKDELIQNICFISLTFKL
jgi:hypothetical protein